MEALQTKDSEEETQIFLRSLGITSQVENFSSVGRVGIPSIESRDQLIRNNFLMLNLGTYLGRYGVLILESNYRYKDDLIKAYSRNNGIKIDDAGCTNSLFHKVKDRWDMYSHNHGIAFSRLETFPRVTVIFDSKVRDKGFVPLQEDRSAVRIWIQKNASPTNISEKLVGARDDLIESLIDFIYQRTSVYAFNIMTGTNSEYEKILRRNELFRQLASL